MKHKRYYDYENMPEPSTHSAPQVRKRRRSLVCAPPPRRSHSVEIWLLVITVVGLLLYIGLRGVRPA